MKTLPHVRGLGEEGARPPWPVVCATLGSLLCCPRMALGPGDLAFVAAVTGAARTSGPGERLQSLWGGYGELLRVRLVGAPMPSAIVKRVRPPRSRDAQGRSHARKKRSYEVETTWYQTLATRCDETCRVPRLYGAAGAADGQLIVLEDLDDAGFAGRRIDAAPKERRACLAWLAAFHALFLGVPPGDLWREGTYWHLATRPDELRATEDLPLRRAAPHLDERLRSAKHQTLVHGDAKEANFCFSRQGDAVAAVDFQYVGGGVGVKDVAYLLSDLAGDAAELEFVDVYFAHLQRELSRRGHGASADQVEGEWRALYPVARADFHRFLAGWAKDHWRRDEKGRRVTAAFLRAAGLD